MAQTRAAFFHGAGALSLSALPLRAAAQPANIRMAGIAFSDLYQEPFLGRDSGIFGKAGVNVDMQPLANSGAIIAALAGGALDVGVGDLISPVLAINSGVPIALLAGSSLFRATDRDAAAICVAKDSPIRQPRDLAGKTIGLPSLVGIASAAAQVWLAHNGVPQQSVKFFEIPTAAMPTAIAAGKLDSALIGEPNLTLVRNDVRTLGNPFAAVAKEYVITAFFASKSWIDADRNRARRLVAAIYDTARWANSHHDETFAILTRNAKLDPEKVKGMARATYATDVTAELVQPQLDAAFQYKLLKEPVDARSIIEHI